MKSSSFSCIVCQPVMENLQILKDVFLDFCVPIMSYSCGLKHLMRSENCEYLKLEKTYSFAKSILSAAPIALLTLEQDGFNCTDPLIRG